MNFSFFFKINYQKMDFKKYLITNINLISFKINGGYFLLHLQLTLLFHFIEYLNFRNIDLLLNYVIINLIHLIFDVPKSKNFA